MRGRLAGCVRGRLAGCVRGRLGRSCAGSVGAAFTEKMNAGFEDDELEFTAVDVEPSKQSNDPPPEFTGTKPTEFKSQRKKVKLWLSVHAHSSSVARPTCLEHADRPQPGMRVTNWNLKMLPLQME